MEAMTAQTCPRVSAEARDYRYPRTVAGLIAARSRPVPAAPVIPGSMLAERPRCGQHGYMALRPARQQTYEQLFCGTWLRLPGSALHDFGADQQP
jgi:hypothetical protein